MSENAYIGHMNALNAIEKFIKSNENPTLGDFQKIRERLLNDGCYSLASIIITYIEEIGQELEDLRADS